MTVQERAAARFAILRERALEGGVLDTAVVDPPAGWCLSTISRLCVNAPTVIAAVERLQRALAPIAAMYVYPRESLHVSLLGCTQREAGPPAADPGRVAAVRRVAEAVVNAHPPARMRLGRVNLLGSQLFVEAVPERDDWSSMRRDLAAGLAAVGEVPIAYADAEPIHLNVARIVAEPDPRLLAAALANTDLDVGSTLTITDLELVQTDFVVSPDTLAVLAQLPMKRD